MKKGINLLVVISDFLWNCEIKSPTDQLEKYSDMNHKNF